MKLRHAFSEETRELFHDTRECWWCGQNHANALHHIMGRVSDSPLNAAPIGNLTCHIGNGALENDESRSRLLIATYQYLMEEKYRLTETDIEFMKRYKYLYEY